SEGVSVARLGDCVGRGSRAGAYFDEPALVPVNHLDRFSVEDRGTLIFANDLASGVQRGGAAAYVEPADPPDTKRSGAGVSRLVSRVSRWPARDRGNRPTDYLPARPDAGVVSCAVAGRGDFRNRFFPDEIAFAARVGDSVGLPGCGGRIGGRGRIRVGFAGQ